MKHPKLNKTLPKLDDLAKFFKFNKGKIKIQVKQLLAEAENDYLQLQEEKQSSINKLETEKASLENLNKEKVSKIHELEAEKTSLENLSVEQQENINKLKAEKHTLKEVEKRFSIISQILSTIPSYNPAMDSFRKVFEEDFMDFANDESSLANEAEAILKLQLVEQKLDIFTKFSQIYDKNIIAIGGGFSSGKSSFINALFTQKNIMLPVGINPVTAIPSYVVSDANDIIRAYSQKGGAISLSPELYKEFSHDFIESFEFNLKDIMPFITVGTEFKKDFQNICFIDTPGYNPAQVGNKEEDENTSKDYLSQANTILWMLDIDRGTLPESDIEFFKHLEGNEKKLYIILNKADLKSQEDIEYIVEEVKYQLEDNHIEFEGISAYSSTLNTEYHSDKKGLIEFLIEENKIKNKMKEEVLSVIDEVMKMYEIALDKDIKKIKELKSNINTLELDLLQSAFDKDDSKLSKNISKMQKSLEHKELEKQKQTAKKIHEKFKSIINELFENIKD